MGKKGLIKVNLKRSRLEALVGVYRFLADNYKPEDGYEELLYEHIVSLYDRLNDILRRENEKNLITFTSLEAKAFELIWSSGVVEVDDPYTGVIITELVKAINKESLQPKRLVAAR